jgi:hypothetical protein
MTDNTTPTTGQTFMVRVRQTDAAKLDELRRLLWNETGKYQTRANVITYLVQKELDRLQTPDDGSVG